jgi:hydroxymethylbilane synthase
LWQANFVRSELERLGVASEVVIIKTAGDRIQDAPVAQIGLKGVFIKELEDALLEGRVDLAVHSMKDVPTEIPAGLAFPAICKRHDPSDALLSRKGAGLRGLPAGARVGTSSVRRQAQLRRLRPDLEFRELRGNVDTRIRKLESGEYDAIVLAKAGLDRLGLSGKVSEVISTTDCLPAVGQGAVGIEARAGDERVRAAVVALDHAATRTALAAERALLAFLEGGCQVPLGALATVAGEELALEGCVVSPDGRETVRDRMVGSTQEPELVGQQLGQVLVSKGAGRILQLAGRTAANG